jgi:hypothetical protein
LYSIIEEEGSVSSFQSQYSVEIDLRRYGTMLDLSRLAEVVLRRSRGTEF